jgi:hypothetical protein
VVVWLPRATISVRTPSRFQSASPISTVNGPTYGRCSDGPGSLSEGFIDGDHVECTFHQGVFNIRTGEVVQPPCIVPVKIYLTVVEDGVVYIEVSDPVPDGLPSEPASVRS